VIESIASAGIAWDDVCIGISRRAELRAPVGSGKLSVLVGALVLDLKEVLLFASAAELWPPSTTRPRRPRASSPLPPLVARPLKRTLRQLGFMPDRARSRDGRIVAGRVGFNRRVTSELVAARISARTFEAMVDVVQGMGRPVRTD
jgi:hypothetical protein